MTDQARLLSLCQEIASMVPSYRLTTTATPQFTKFIDSLRGKVEEHEINAIIRAYNYFNYLMGIGPEVDDTPGSNDLVIEGAASKKKRRSNDSNDSNDTDDSDDPDEPDDTDEPKDEPPDTDSEEMIQLLLNLSEESESV